MKRIHCLGVLVVDALSGPLGSYPVPRRQPQVLTESLRFMPGGGAANTGAALARMGRRAAVFSKVGAATNGAFLVKELERVGVDASGICVSDKDTTPFTYVGIHPDGERTFIHTPGANLTFTLDDLNREALLSADFLLYQDCWVLPGIDGKPGAGLLAAARRRGVVTLLDECWGLGPKREVFERMVPHCDYVMPSLDDMRAILPGLSADQIAEHLLGLGARTVVLKMGARGCLVARGAERIRVPALRAKVADTTGAGDCWNAGFIAGLAHGEDVPVAARLGAACAAFCIEAVGGATGVPDYARVQRRAGR